MPNTHTYWRTDRPAEGFYTTALPNDPTLTVRTFLPEHYEPRYPYPLLVLFHGRGSNEEQVLRLAPKLSRRNFVAISLRGPNEIGQRDNGFPACSWGENGGSTETISEYVTRAVEQTRRTYHIHSERIYLVGVNEGATAAYRAAFLLGDQIAGVVALNGTLPRPQDKNPLFRLDQIRRQRVFISHSSANSAVMLPDAVRDQRLLYAAGAQVQFSQYRAKQSIPAEMLKDVNRWIISNVNAEHDSYARKAVK